VGAGVAGGARGRGLGEEEDGDCALMLMMMLLLLLLLLLDREVCYEHVSAFVIVRPAADEGREARQRVRGGCMVDLGVIWVSICGHCCERLLHVCDEGLQGLEG
jgi:hypothetical protein